MEYLINKFIINYYTKEEIGYRLPSQINLDEFWNHLIQARQKKAEFLPYQDQKGKPFWFVLTPPLQQNLHSIDSRGKDSLYKAVREEIQNELMEQALIEEALFSSVIEGAFSTLARARELIVGGKRPRDHNDQMVKNNGQVMRYVWEHRSDSCSIELMHKLQRLATEKTLEEEKYSGQFRNALVYITNAQGEVIYTAPPAETVAASMQALVDWINKEEERPFIHPILVAAILHTYFVYVHPYFDGNGRTARSLFYWYLLKHQYDFFRYFSISSIIQETRSQYYKALKNMEDCDADLTYILLYMTESVVKAIEVVLTRITEQYRRETLFSKIQKQGLFLNERQKRFLKHFAVAKDKTITLAKYQKDFKVVYETARRDLLQLEKIGILTKRQYGRRFVYTLNPAFLR